MRKLIPLLLAFVGFTAMAAEAMKDDHYVVAASPAALPGHTELVRRFPGGIERLPLGIEWKIDECCKADAAIGTSKEFWVADPPIRGYGRTNGAIIVWAAEQGWRPATLREAVVEFVPANPKRQLENPIMLLGATAEYGNCIVVHELGEMHDEPTLETSCSAAYEDYERFLLVREEG